MSAELRLLADIGGTNARFALQSRQAGLLDIEVLACADYPDIADAVRAYLARAAARGHAAEALRHAAFAIATPVDGDEVAMTNHHWRFSIAGLRDALGFATLLVVNDFAALARALPHLDESGRARVGGDWPGNPDGATVFPQQMLAGYVRVYKRGH